MFNQFWCQECNFGESVMDNPHWPRDDCGVQCHQRLWAHLKNWSNVQNELLWKEQQRQDVKSIPLKPLPNIHHASLFECSTNKPSAFSKIGQWKGSFVGVSWNTKEISWCCNQNVLISLMQCFHVILGCHFLGGDRSVFCVAVKLTLRSPLLWTNHTENLKWTIIIVWEIIFASKQWHLFHTMTGWLDWNWTNCSWPLLPSPLHAKESGKLTWTVTIFQVIVVAIEQFWLCFAMKLFQENLLTEKFACKILDAKFVDVNELTLWMDNLICVSFKSSLLCSSKVNCVAQWCCSVKLACAKICKQHLLKPISLMQNSLMQWLDDLIDGFKGIVIHQCCCHCTVHDDSSQLRWMVTVF